MRRQSNENGRVVLFFPPSRTAPLILSHSLSSPALLIPYASTAAQPAVQKAKAVQSRVLEKKRYETEAHGEVESS